MKTKKLSPISYQLTIGWLYPELMSTYGDRGNITALTKRCEWRNIRITIKRITLISKIEDLRSSDLIFMGGAQDTQQEIVNQDLFEKKGDTLKKLIEDRTPGLFICGAYQFLGKYYKTADGIVLPGLGIFPCFTKNPGEKVPRLTGNIMIRSNIKDLTSNIQLVGFENHGGRTYLENPEQDLGKVIKGFGNNGTDKTEGIIYKNSIGTYLHGPILPKNPELADWLIQKALEKKYSKKIQLEELDDFMEHQAKDIIVKRVLS